MNREKLLQNPLPIDRVALRVVKPACEYDLWNPIPKSKINCAESSETLETAPLPKAAPKELLNLTGKRRGRMVIVGYAKNQGGGNAAKWVVRCDCGRYEHRTRILRWLNTDCVDLCRLCNHRMYKLHGQWRNPNSPKRNTHI